MSSIDEDTLRRLTGPLFDALTATSALPAPFPLGPDANLSSYYTKREQPSMRRGDFDAPSCLDLADFEQRLAVYWKRAGQVELAACAPVVAAAARELKALYGQAQAEPQISPYIYSMF